MPEPKPIFILLRPEEVLQAVSDYARQHRGLPEGEANVKLLSVYDEQGIAIQYRLEIAYSETPA